MGKIVSSEVMLDLSFPLFKLTVNNEIGRPFASKKMWFPVMFPKKNKKLYLRFDYDLTNGEGNLADDHESIETNLLHIP